MGIRALDHVGCSLHSMRLLMSSKTARAGAGSGEVLGRTPFLRLPAVVGCGSFMACGPAGCRGEAWLKEGFAQLEVALPVLADRCSTMRGGVTWIKWSSGWIRTSCRSRSRPGIPARCCGLRAGSGRTTATTRAMLKVAHQWPDRVWAVEGANGIGRPIAPRLLGRSGAGAGRAGQARRAGAGV